MGPNRRSFNSLTAARNSSKLISPSACRWKMRFDSSSRCRSSIRRLAIVATSARCRFTRSCSLIGVAVVAMARRREEFFRLHIQKAHTHRTVPHDAFQVAHPAAAAELLFRIERDHGMAGLPDAIQVRVAAEANAIAQVPNANQRFQAAA